ncbi:MAG: hypothetical protein M1837_005662 [Sclerophora amabilis]|nr:MAG: hypothetical protein M1837_005662 [Sclerophora amabilis]
MPAENQKRDRADKTLSSCTLCQRRKIKCDKQDPCSNCSRAGQKCILLTRSRLPRGRQGGRKKVDTELLQRIAKLENLVKDLETEQSATQEAPLVADDGQRRGNQSDRKGGSNEATTASIVSSETPAHAVKSNLDRYLGSAFWVTLSDGITGLREVLDQSSDDESEDDKQSPNSESPLAVEPRHPDFVLGGLDLDLINKGSLQHPSPSHVHELCSIFLSNVDPVFKLLHGPSLRKYMQEGKGYLDYGPGHKGTEALSFAVYYAATASLVFEECRQLFGEEKASLLTRYRSGTELALARADVVNTVNISTLQALVLFLLTVRCHDTTRLTWTLTSLAVRIAHALSIHREDAFGSLSPFQKQMRRRLWWQICVLDIQCCEDRGSDPIIVESSFNTRLPLNIDDEDLSFDSTCDPQEREAFTQMTFCQVCHEVSNTVRSLNYVPPGESQPSDIGSDETWKKRQGLVTSCQEHLERKYLRYCNTSIPFHWATRTVADTIIASLWLNTYRPLQSHGSSATSLRIADTSILHLSVEVLDKTHQLETEPSVKSFRWFFGTYVQWHALAVTIAELCVHTEGAIVERAWNVVIPVFGRASQQVADSRKGMLWRPVKKLMNKAQRIRQARIQVHPDSGRDADLALGGSRPLGKDTSSVQAQQPPISSDAFGKENVQDNIPSYDLSFNTGSSFTMAPEVPLIGSSSNTVPQHFDWNPWLVPETSTQAQINDEMNQMAWANWEEFIEDFHGEADFFGTGAGSQRIGCIVPHVLTTPGNVNGHGNVEDQLT